METRKLFIQILLLLIVVSLSKHDVYAQVSEAEKVYEKAIYEIEATGDFEKAIKLLNVIVKEYSADKTIAAKALLKLGFCYERQGSQKAEEVYTRIIEKFSEQSSQVAAARERLAALHEQNEVAGQTIKLSYDGSILESNSLSPNGTKMALTEFSEGQNIAYFDFSTEELVHLTHHNWTDMWTYYPVWSPDGKEISYIKAKWDNSASFSLWSSTLDGKERLLYANSEPGSRIYPREWLPNGKGIVVILQDSSGYSLAIIPSSGEGGFEVLKKFDQKNLTTASVSPDSKYVVFADGVQGNKNIRIIDIKTKGITTLINNPANDVSPRWSPDGNHIIFCSYRHGERAIWGIAVKGTLPQGAPFMILAGGKDLRLLNWTPAGLALNKTISIVDQYKLPVDPSTGKSVGQPELIPYSPTGANYNGVWSPDGKSIAFMKQNMQKHEPAVVVMSVEDFVTREFLLPPNTTAGVPRWTPDGKAISFLGSDNNKKKSLYRLKLENGNWESWPLEFESGTGIEWNKDGKTYYYGAVNTLKEDETGNDDWMIIKKTIGTPENKIIYKGKNVDYAFRGFRCSRDYNMLAFQQNNYVMALNLEREEATLLTPVTDTCDSHGLPSVIYRNPTWSPDGKKIMTSKVLISEDMKQISYELYVFNTVTGKAEKVELGNTLPKDYQIKAIDWSPDGNEVLISIQTWMIADYLMKIVIPKKQFTDK